MSIENNAELIKGHIEAGLFYGLTVDRFREWLIHLLYREEINMAEFENLMQAFKRSLGED
ncbi:MAG: hypothetical protein JXB38_08230 [Anaerolineales bacterium]|nr:hypothetical protein [Anaerolineales bacterium]